MSGRPLLSVVVALASPQWPAEAGATFAAPTPAATRRPPPPRPRTRPPRTTAAARPSPADWLGTRVFNPVPGEPPPPTPPHPADHRRARPADGAFATVSSRCRPTSSPARLAGGLPVTLDELRYVATVLLGLRRRGPHRRDDRAPRRRRRHGPGLRAAVRRALPDRGRARVIDGRSQHARRRRRQHDRRLRPAGPAPRGSSRWSDATGWPSTSTRSNPYVRDGGVIPGLAGSYLEHANVRPGMLEPGRRARGRLRHHRYGVGAASGRTPATTCTSAPAAGGDGRAVSRRGRARWPGRPRPGARPSRSAVR